MEYELRVIVEKVAISTQKVVKRDTLKVYDIKSPDSILELGLRHQEQISLLSKVQNSLLAEQSALIEADPENCPKCGQKLRKNGTNKSKFHSVFSDHQLRIRQHHCINPDCHWSSSPSVKSVFGTNQHPDLAKLQCEQGALFSYREAQQNLAKLNCQQRSVNNHTQIKRITDRVGSVISSQNLEPISAQVCKISAAELIVQIDGGHIPIQDRSKRSFEALSSIVYPPESLEKIDNYHRQITNKSCVISALKDGLKTMKTYLLNAAYKQGMSEQTKITALADGASNCWSVLLSLKPYCQKLTAILDWFHISQKYQRVKSGLSAVWAAELESSKWHLWHGKVEESLSQLAQLQTRVQDPKQRERLLGLYRYIEDNRSYVVNYEQRKQTGQVLTSQTAESHVELLINARHKRSGKMQWNRETAHNVLQIRAKMASNEWRNEWQAAVLSALGVAA